MWRSLGITAAADVSGVLLRVFGVHRSPGLAAFVPEAGIGAVALLLAWAADAAQRDIAGALALAPLALSAVLPEYAVDDARPMEPWPGGRAARRVMSRTPR